jgi:hypothetical protein
MTDYPTRAEIDTTAETIEALQNAVDRSKAGWGVVWNGLETAREILDVLDHVPGLHYPDAEPEPQPKPTAAEVLEAAWVIADDGSANESILYAALRYAQTNPEWFKSWHGYNLPSSALIAASNEATYAGVSTAAHLLTAASCVASDHRHLFGGAE